MESADNILYSGPCKARQAIDVASIRITAHAAEQYVKRAKGIGRQTTNPEEEVRWMLSRAAKVELDGFHSVLRLIKNGFQPARYYRYMGWRFVVANGVLKTVERVRPWQN